MGLLKALAAFIATGSLWIMNAQPAPISLKSIPFRLEWINKPADFKVHDETGLEIVAAKSTDRFTSPIDGSARANSPWLLFETSGDFALRAKVTVDFRTRWDAGALVVYVDGQYWAKLCFEYSTAKRPTIVSVVTRGASDDANAIAVEGSTVYLQVARVGPALLFYSSENGNSWQLIRAFTLGTPESPMKDKLRAGFSSQSPAGDGCRSVFSEITYRATRLKDFRLGQ